MSPKVLKGSLWAALACLIAPSASHATLLASERFDDDGSGVRYRVEGAGGQANDFWGLQSIGHSLGFEGDGSDFFAGRDLDGRFGGGADLRAVELLPVDVSGFSVLSVSVDLAAETGEWESGDPDALRIFAIDAETGARSLVDEFLPDATRRGDLVGRVSGVALDGEFQTLRYDVAAEYSSLTLRFEAQSTGNRESLGIDNVTVAAGAGDRLEVTEPGLPILLASAGLLGLLLVPGSRARAAERRRLVGAQIRNCQG